MRLAIITPVAALLLAAAAAPAAAQSSSANWDGLVEVNARQLDAAFLLPGADFRPYTKVMLEEPEVAFRQNWMRDMNRSRSPGRRVTEQDAAQILQAVSASTIDIFSRAFTDAGFEVVTRPGPDVLRIRTGVLNLFVNAPDTMSAGRSTTFTANAGEATLVLEARDSPTNALLARVVDRRETRGIPGPTNRVTNTSEFRQMAGNWSRIAASRLRSLQEISPIPDPLTPGQRLP
jgi:outer membrane receptor protein involved in Fe transport